MKESEHRGCDWQPSGRVEMVSPEGRMVQGSVSQSAGGQRDTEAKQSVTRTAKLGESARTKSLNLVFNMSILRC